MANRTYRDRAKREISADVTTVCGFNAVVFMHPDSTVLVYLYPGKPEMSDYAIDVMCAPSLRKAMKASVKRAYELGLGDVGRHVSEDEALAVQSTWRSFHFQSWLESVDASSWMEASNVEAVLREVLVIGPVMDR